MGKRYLVGLPGIACFLVILFYTVKSVDATQLFVAFFVITYYTCIIITEVHICTGLLWKSF